MMVRRVLSVLGLGLALLLGSAGPAFSAAARDTTNVRFPISLAPEVPCALGGAGETVLFSGEAHLLAITTTDSRGGRHVVLHANYQGLGGEGLSSGDPYRAVAAETSSLFDAPNGAPVAHSIAQTVQIVGTGPGNNFLIHFQFHVTVNANGDVTVGRYELRIECR